MDRNISNQDRKKAEDAVDSFQKWNLLWKNTKYLEDGETLQIRIGDALRVQFKVQEDGEKEIVDCFYKDWHKSHR